MPRTHTLLTVADFIYRHLDARPVPHLPRLARAKVLERAFLLARICKARVMTGGTVPFYNRDDDIIVVPPPAFYTVLYLVKRPTACAIDLLHELTHWSGHRRRLGRRQHREPFDDVYLREELIAELGAALLCHDLAITSRPALPHARYLNRYLAALPNPAIDLSVALSHANQAAAYLLGVARRDLY